MINWLFIAIIFFLPLQFALNLGENVDLVTTRVLIPAVFLLWLIRGMAQRKIWIPNRAETWLILSFLFLSARSLFGGVDPSNGTRKILYLFSILPVFFVAADLARNKIFRTRIIRAVWASGVLAAMAGMVQFLLPFIIGINPTLKIWKSIAPIFLGSAFGKLVTADPSWLVNISGTTRMRAFGFFPDPHVFSFFVSLCFFAGIGIMFSEKNGFRKATYGIGNALMLLLVLLSFSRGAYLGIIFGLFFFGLFVLKRKQMLGKVAIAGAIVALVAVSFYQQVIFQRFASAFDFKEGSNVERVKNWSQAVDMISSHPILGVGLGNYASVVDPLAGERSSIYAHNLFLDVAAETGILNGIIFLTLSLVAIWRNVRGKNILDLGLAAGLVYFLVHGIFDTPIWSPQVLVMFLIVIALGLAPISKERAGDIIQIDIKTKNEK